MPHVRPAAEFQNLVTSIAGNLHAGQVIDAARIVLKIQGSSKDPRNNKSAFEPLVAFLHFCLDQDYYEEAARLLWTPTMFTPEPRCSQISWEEIRSNAAVLLQGASSMSKTYGAGVYFFLDWLRDPEFTTVKVLGPSEDHLQNNLFSHLVNLHRSSSIPLPGHVGDLFIGLDLRNRRSAITGVIVPLGRRAAGRLQGTKRFPRPTPHPRFGPLSRARILLDEFEQIPVGIHADLDNVVSNVEGTEGLKIVGAYNPQKVGEKVYQIAEPPKGWGAFDIDKDEVWTSRRGWRVVRLDGEKSENAVAGKVVFPGLQTKEGLERLATMSGGTTSAGYYTFGRGAYPPQGTSLSVIPSSHLTTSRARFIWMGVPTAIGAVDSALEGDDSAYFAHGQYGYATGIDYPPSIEFPAGHKVMFKDDRDIVVPRFALQVSQLFPLPRGNTVAAANDIKRIAHTIGILPGNLLLDRTGNGAGVHDVLKEIWAGEVRGLNYSESATHMKILAEDSTYADDNYDRVYSELWFATRRWLEFGVIKLLPDVPTEGLFHQFTTRLYLLAGGKSRVEPKRDWKQRNEGKSPNEADAVTLLVHCCRLVSGETPGMGVKRQVLPREVEMSTLETRVDPTNRLDGLDGVGRPASNWPPRSRMFDTEDTLD